MSFLYFKPIDNYMGKRSQKDEMDSETYPIQNSYINVSTTQTSEQRYLLVDNPLRFVRLNER